MTMNTNRITAVFSGMPEAEAAVADLRRLGVTDAHISSVSRHGDHVSGTATGVGDGRSSDERSHDINEGTGKGLLAGEGVGALEGLAAEGIAGGGPFI
ncbi:hypothetical protein [Deinococcus pimensis]|uniref:hypothetical protein n=1 Tax=Deinococcus pimensis TaxID=309888 RepID=UPI0004800A7C|nr:hypothetical protein [Deinococcus pimensis]